MIYYFGRFWWFDGCKEYKGESVTSSHGSVSAYLGNVMYAEFTSVSDHICNRLFSTGEDNFRAKRMANFCKLFGKYQDAEGKFEQLEHHLCTQNTEYSGGLSYMQCQEVAVFCRLHGS